MKFQLKIQFMLLRCRTKTCHRLTMSTRKCVRFHFSFTDFKRFHSPNVLDDELDGDRLYHELVSIQAKSSDPAVDPIQQMFDAEMPVHVYPAPAEVCQVQSPPVYLDLSSKPQLLPIVSSSAPVESVVIPNVASTPTQHVDTGNASKSEQSDENQSRQVVESPLPTAKPRIIYTTKPIDLARLNKAVEAQQFNKAKLSQLAVNKENSDSSEMSSIGAPRVRSSDAGGEKTLTEIKLNPLDNLPPIRKLGNSPALIMKLKMQQTLNTQVTKAMAPPKRDLLLRSQTVAVTKKPEKEVKISRPEYKCDHCSKTYVSYPWFRLHIDNCESKTAKQTESAKKVFNASRTAKASKSRADRFNLEATQSAPATLQKLLTTKSVKTANTSSSSLAKKVVKASQTVKMSKSTSFSSKRSPEASNRVKAASTAAKKTVLSSKTVMFAWSRQTDYNLRMTTTRQANRK